MCFHFSQLQDGHANAGEHLSGRQLVLEKFIKHVSTSTAAIVMLVALALLSALRDPDPETSRPALCEATNKRVTASEQKKSFSMCDAKISGIKAP